MDELMKLPSLPFMDLPKDFDQSSTSISEHIISSQVKFFDKGYINIYHVHCEVKLCYSVYQNRMCAASLKTAGGCLVTHCLCEWMTNKKPPFDLSKVAEWPVTERNQYSV